MTHARDLLAEAVHRSNLRAVAKDVGISHQALSDYLDNSDKARERTQEKVRRWAQQQLASDQDDPIRQGRISEAIEELTKERADRQGETLLDRELAYLNSLGISEREKIWKLEVVASAIWAEAAREAERAAQIRADAMRAAEMAALARAKAAGQRFDTGLPREREKLVPPPGEIGGGKRTG
jgi:hypothetical protein